MSQDYRHKNTSVFLLNYHFVWIVRRRREVLSGTVETRLVDLIHVKSQELDCRVIALEVMPDHVHLFLNGPTSLCPDQIMHRIKGYTSRILRKEHSWLMKLPSMWTRSYFASTAGNVSSKTIQKYIESQKRI